MSERDLPDFFARLLIAFGILLVIIWLFNPGAFFIFVRIAVVLQHLSTSLIVILLIVIVWWLIARERRSRGARETTTKDFGDAIFQRRSLHRGAYKETGLNYCWGRRS